MKTVVLNILIAVTLVAVLNSCTTSRNTFINRGYHNLTARYNGYYYATESVKEGEFKIRADYPFDYDKILPIYLIPTNESAKNTFPDFDKAIKKSSNCIQKHTIKDRKTKREVYTAGHWIDNNWNVIGISHFYKREFFSGIEAFEYVIRSYKSRDKYKAMIWLAKSYNEIGSPTQAEPVIGLLKDDKKISKYAKMELPALRADYYIKRGMYKEAEKQLELAIKQKPSRKTRARYSFILAQLYEEKRENKKAIQFYKKVVSLKPNYELVFNAKMKQAGLFDVNSGNISKLKRELTSMTYDIKNKEYLDVIYYTLGGIYEREKNVDVAVVNYKLSVKNSTQNPKQKALSYLKLGELSFEAAEYTASGAYYDSTMLSLPKEYKDYEAISKRKTTLETLVSYIKTIQTEDSLQRMAKMTEADRDKYIANIIKKIEKEEEKKQDDLDNALNQNQNPNYNPNAPSNGVTPTVGNDGKAAWYFYNQTTISFGLNDFVKKWGNRKLEDNWRRSQKAMSFDNATSDATDTSKTKNPNAIKNNASVSSSTKKTKEYYLENVPLSDSLMQVSDNKIVDSYYNLASTYKDELNNNKKSIESYEKLNNRYPANKYKVATYYQLYKIYTATRNQAQADNYKNKLFNEFPNSEYTQILKNPNYIAEKNSQKGEVELFYTETFNQYASGNYTEAFNKSALSFTKFGKNEFEGKFAYIKAMSTGKIKGADSLEAALKQFKVLYPKEPATKQAQDVLNVLYDLKHPSEATGNATGAVNNTDTFNLNLEAEHFVIILYPDEPAMANTFKNSLANFSTTFYSNKNYNISSSLFGAAQQLTIVKTFKNAAEAIGFEYNLKSDKTVFTGNVKAELFTILSVSAENLPKVYKRKQVETYKPFHDEHYKKP